LGADTMRYTLPVRLPVPPGAPAAAPVPPGAVTPGATAPSAIVPGPVLLGTPAAADSGDVLVTGRTLPGGTYRWFFLPGTVAQRTAVQNGFARLELAPGLAAWVADSDAHPLPVDSVAGMAASVPPARVVGDVRVRSAAAYADVVMPMASPPPYLVEQEGSALVLTLYGTTANTDRINFAPDDALVRNVTWEQLPGGMARYRLEMAHPVFGYLALWRDGAFVLRVRRRPAVDPRVPLRGLRIAVDAGHPPVGATGPTGLYEAEATLAVSRVLREELERRGATVVMTRTTMDPVALGDRPIIARRADAHALVSIHLNAFPDGVNPYVNNGTSTYYFQPQSAPLARAVQEGMVRRMGLRDLGTFYGNLALVRPTWMPSVLAEGAFLMIPEQEAAMRTPEYQRAYALGVADGLEAFFRALGPGETR
ncbi:MAG TPA: N-acetylmuramoyl-L-alanine amidase, partial [Gemmatimonadaceae bacterium]|nr:N-acetylmuramoyl-L-alanine amidase [Gemmatimonadaceae bacterium]